MRGYRDCKTCAHQRTAKCLPCTSGQNFEPKEIEELDFENDTLNFEDFDGDQD